MMRFRTVSAALVDLLGASAAGRFTVVGYQRQLADASQLRGNNRRVQCYYTSGEFPKSSGRQTGTTQHVLTYNIDLSVSAAAKANLAVINSPNSTPSQIATALAAAQEAAYLADASFDELVDHVYQILMDGRNFDLGLPVGTISKRWVDSVRKDDVEEHGSLVVLTGRLQYTCQTAEDITGDTGTACGVISTVIDIDGDDVERTGVEVTP